MSAMRTVFELMDVPDLAEDIGQNIRLARVAKGLRQEDVAKASGASLQAIKNLEGGVNVELTTFLRVTKALGMGRAVWEACKPQPRTLNEIDLIERAKIAPSRVRLRSR